MNLSEAILGKPTVTKLQARTTAPVLTIGEDTFTRPQLAKVACFNFTAAARLSNLITNELKVKNTAELFKTVKPIALAIPGLGSICLATIGAAFEAKRLGTLSSYVAHHADEGDHSVTFDTIKHRKQRDQDAEQRTKRAERSRVRGRKRAAHELRVSRHLSRATH